MVLFTTKTVHEEIVDDGFYHIQFCNFLNCQNSNGGAILCDVPGDRLIELCYFSHCRANHATEGRGAAFFIRKGNNTIKNTCCENCSATFGGDMMEFDGDRVACSNVQTTKFSAIHSAYFRAYEIVLVNINITRNDISAKQAYGSAFNIGNCSEYTTKYILAAYNNGGKSVFSFEYQTIEAENYHTQFANAIGNTGSDSLIYQRQSIESPLIFSNSNFYKNSATYFFTFDNKENNYMITFSNCSFDFKDNSINTEVVKLQSCKYTFTTNTQHLDEFQCVVDPQFTQKSQIASCYCACYLRYTLLFTIFIGKSTNK